MRRWVLKTQHRILLCLNIVFMYAGIERIYKRVCLQKGLDAGGGFGRYLSGWYMRTAARQQQHSLLINDAVSLKTLTKKGRWWKCHFSFAHRRQRRWFLVSDHLKLRYCVSTAAIQSSYPVTTVEHKATAGPRVLFTAQIHTMWLWFWAV